MRECLLTRISIWRLFPYHATILHGYRDWGLKLSLFKFQIEVWNFIKMLRTSILFSGLKQLRDLEFENRIIPEKTTCRNPLPPPLIFRRKQNKLENFVFVVCFSSPRKNTSDMFWHIAPLPGLTTLWQFFTQSTKTTAVRRIAVTASRHYGGPIESPPEHLQTSQQYSIEGSEGPHV